MTKIFESNPWNVDGTILHIGAGQCGELEKYLESPASVIVLVEPNPEYVRILKEYARQHDRIKVINAAISGSDGMATLYLCNFEHFNGLRSPKKLSRQLPGLKAENTVQVETLTISSLLKEISLEKDKTHCLMIEAKGEEAAILSGLKKVSGHPVFKHIVAHDSTFSHTDQPEVTSFSLIAKLAETGYRIDEVVVHEAGHLAFSAKIDEYWRKYLKIKKEISELKEKQEKKLVDEEAYAKQLEEANEKASNLQTENKQLKAENDEFKQRKSILEDELRKAEIQIELIKDLFLKVEQKNLDGKS